MQLLLQNNASRILEGTARDCEYKEVGTIGGIHGGWLIKHP